MSDNLTEQESQALNRDIGQLEALIEELLTYARPDRPQNELKLSVTDLPVWLTTHLEDVQSVNLVAWCAYVISKLATMARWICA